MLWQHGFSTYTCLPASRARSAIGACQWSGVAIVTPSIDASSRIRRKSPTPFAPPDSLTAFDEPLLVDVGDIDNLRVFQAAIEHLM